MLGVGLLNALGKSMVLEENEGVEEMNIEHSTSNIEWKRMEEMKRNKEVKKFKKEKGEVLKF